MDNRISHFTSYYDIEVPASILASTLIVGHPLVPRGTGVIHAMQ